jgi:transcriptional regulator with XRE-family HTH domain
MVGRVLRRIRLEQGRTLADVSRAARVSMPYLSEVERGRKEASSEVLAAVCDALGVDLADVLGLIGSDLAGDRGRRAAVIRLDAVRPEAVRPEAIRQEAIRQEVIRLEAIRSRHIEAAPGRAPSPGRGAGDVQCLLAA